MSAKLQWLIGRTIFFLLMLSFSFPAGTSSGQNAGIYRTQDSAQEVEMPQDDIGVMVKLATERAEYQPGETVALALAIVAQGEDHTLIFRISQRFDVTATRNGMEVWRWSEDRVFLMVLGDETFRRDDPTVFVMTWDLRDNKGIFLPEGEYQIRGILTAEDALYSQPVTIRVGHHSPGK